jgi:hypothetical protein
MDIAVRMIGTLRFPLFKAIRSRLTELLDNAGLVLDAGALRTAAAPLLEAGSPSSSPEQNP